jgi:hypothetical protein
MEGTLALSDYETAVERLERSLTALCDCWDRLADGLEDQSSKYVALLDAMNASLQASGGDDPADAADLHDEAGLDSPTPGRIAGHTTFFDPPECASSIDQIGQHLLAPGIHLFALERLPRKAA